MKAIEITAKAVTITKDVLHALAGVSEALKVLDAAVPFLAVVGDVLSLVEMFIPHEDPVMLALKQIMSQVSNLEQDMHYYFEKVLSAVRQDTCYQTYAQYEQKIVNANKHLQTMLDNQNSTDIEVYKQSFMNECSDNACDDAA